ncbi:MAG: aconitase family protein [Patescibacteria group bacterium]|nr:aconitase family protein [Patescibacteria group bacterium]
MAKLERSFYIGEQPKILALVEGSMADLLKAQLNDYQIDSYNRQILDSLISGISTDAILPSKAGKFRDPKDLANYALSGLPGISEGVVNGKFKVLVVGGGFGCGSAREHAPRALKGAGIELIIVVGGKAEKIFKENCLYCGGPKILELPNDIDKLQSVIGKLNCEGEFVWACDDISDIELEIVNAGGLLEYTKRRLEGRSNVPFIFHPSVSSRHPMTAVEKLLHKKFKNIHPLTSYVMPGDVGIVDLDLRFSYEFMTEMIIEMLVNTFGSDVKNMIKDPDSILLFEDHLVWLPEKFRSLIQSQRKISNDFNLKLFAQSDNLPGALGICHTLIVENAMVLPGQTVIGTDSHTCSAGVLGAFAFGSGATAVASSFVSKEAIVRVPETVKVEFSGNLKPGVFAKDVMLFLLSQPLIKNGGAIDKILEFVGTGIQDWSVDELFVLTNMSIECGALGIIPQPVESVVSHLQNVTRMSRNEIMNMYMPSDPDANYANVLHINLSELQPMVATPGHPTNGTLLSNLLGTKITRAFVGSCTGGKITDLREVAKVLKGRKVSVPLVVQVSSMKVYELAIQEGIVDIIESAGCKLLLPGCGACIGMGPGRVEDKFDVIISSTNRNFPGRMGRASINGQEVDGGDIYLSNPSVVAASAIKGYICSVNELD